MPFPAPLYTSFAECAAAIDILERILSTNDHHDNQDADELVT